MEARKRSVTKTLGMVLAFSLCAALLSGVFLLMTHDSASAVATQAAGRSINVNGEGIIVVEPDMAVLSLGVVTQHKEAKTAQTQNATAMNALIEAVKAAGIDSKDMKTERYSIYPNYSYEDKSGKQTLIGYSVNSSLSVTVRDLKKLGSLYDVAVSKGANMASGPQFTVSDHQKYYNEALRQAVASGGDKAKVLADAIGVTIGKPSMVTENSSSTPPYAYSSLSARAEADMSTPVVTGQIEIRASVTLSYAY